MGRVDRKPYLTASVLNQEFLDECQDNLTNQLELIIEVETPSRTLYLSDRNKYVDGKFYEARLNFPVISRTIGEYLNPSLEFSQLQIEINNVDGFLNDDLASGPTYTSWMGKSVIVKIGLRDVGSTYKEIFSGKITEEGGFQRSTKSVTLIYRNDFNQLNKEFPKTVFKSSVFPDIETEYENMVVPIIYGDWTVSVEPGGASVPAYPVNGENENVNGETDYSENLQLVISNDVLSFFDSSEVYILQSDTFYKFDPADIQNVVDNRAFEIRQKDCSPPSVTLINGELYGYKKGDKIFCKVKGKDLGTYDDNIISQARDILINHLDQEPGLLHSSWDYYRDKSTPAVSAISTFKSRIWLQEAQPGLNYVLSLLEQVRLEAFINRDGLLALSSLHFDQFIASPSYSITNWDIERDSFQPKLDEKLNFNRARGSFNFLPNRNENYQETGVYKNEAAILQIGKEISKRIVFPNLYDQTVVSNQVIEILKICSSYLEIINVTLTWRSLLKDIGDFVKINTRIGGTQFDNVPGLIREIGYDPQGIRIPAVIWSFQMTPFPGWNPTYNGIVGGNSAVITLE